MSPASRTVHPRVRGDHVRGYGRTPDGDGSSPRSRGPRSSDSGRAEIRGSSPRSRGPPERHRGHGSVRRFIPAFAGTTGRRAFAEIAATVHPRVRGDHNHSTHQAMNADGSSPRSRGPPRNGYTAGSKSRFIPAFAGTTRCARTLRGRQSVHPRVRGDHRERHLPIADGIGSSPRSRGPRQLGRYQPGGNWFIPAFAGTTWW